MTAYGQSGGYAEQALNSIRIVVSFGQEELECRNYNFFLEQVRKVGMKQGRMSALSLGFFLCTVYISYSYSFAMGAIWVDEGIWNHFYDRPYTSGDIMGCFFGVLLGLMALGGVGPGFTAKAAA